MILLINPPFFRFQGLEQNYPPISLIDVGNKLQAMGNDVIIKNMEMDSKLKYKGYSDRSENYDLYLQALKDNNHPVWQYLRSYIKFTAPDEIGITVLNVKHKSALKIIEIASEFEVPVFVGGMHPTIHPDKYPDYVQVYQGEFMSELESKINYDILDDIYSSEGYGHIITSFGCPYKCRFCASANIWNHKVKFKSVDTIIKEMQYLKDTFCPDHFTIWDETFFMNKKRIKEFCEKYTLNIPWRCDTRADTITVDLIKMVKKVGLDQLSMGIESGSNKILSYINKGETIEDYIKASYVLNDNNIKWKAYIIIGFPEETIEDILQTIRFVKSLHPFRITMSVFTPYPGTPLYDECIEKGLIKKDEDLSIYAHQSNHNYFTPKIPKEEFFQLRNEISKEIDLYNQEALKVWI